VRPVSSSLKDAGPIRVIAADDQPLFRDALGRALRRDRALEVVDEAAEAEALAEAIEREGPDVVLVDAALADEATAAAGSARVLVLVAEVDAAEAHAGIAAGAAGYVSKDVDGEVICRAVAAVARGEVVLDPELRTGVAREIRMRSRDVRPVLSPREHEILVLIAEGVTAPDIALRLRVSTATVKTHVFHLYEKLGVTERAAAVAEAMRKGLLE